MLKTLSRKGAVGYNQSITERVNAVKPVSLNQLLFHPKSRTLSVFYAPTKSTDEEMAFEFFFEEMRFELDELHDAEMIKLITEQKSNISKVIYRQPQKTCGFFLSDSMAGYTVLENEVDSYYQVGPHFHVRPILEETFTNPEFILINVSFYDIKVYRGDFHHLEVVDQFEFDNVQNTVGSFSPRYYAPQYMGMIPYKTILALKNISRKISEKILYESVPVVVTGLSDTKIIFLQGFEHSFGIISHLEEDFYEKTCVEIIARCKKFRSVVTDYYSAQLKERLKRMVKSPRLLSDLGEIIEATKNGNVIHLVIPTDKKVWGQVDFETGDYEIHKRLNKNTPSVDLLNEIAEEVIKQGGKIQILSPHFFPLEASALAILKGSQR
jgi:hypothetical protein